MKRWNWLLAALLAVMALGVAACGGDDEEQPAGGGEQTEQQGEGGEKLRVAMVTDIGGLNDRSFNQSAYEGLQRAESELGVEIRAVTSNSNADYVPNLTTLARQDYDLIVAVGFLMAEATEQVANQFPDVNFAIIDSSAEAMESSPGNLQGLLFRENEAGYLVGYAAGLYLEDEGGNEQVASSVGGQKIPPVDAYIAGFQAGLEAANPDAESLNGYSQDFVDQAKCKEIALEQIDRGSQVIFQVAGQCGLGALDAAQENDLQGIGVDADQSFLGDHILTSALKKIDEAVFQTVQQVQDGSFEGGTDTVFDVASGGVGFGELNEAGAQYEDQLNDIQQQIADGEISDIPSEVE
jgi:basic membrane protein A and related proteins